MFCDVLYSHHQNERERMSSEVFILIAEYLGVFAFAISGFRRAAARQYDIFGAVVIGFITAGGGGTLRDLLIGRPVFWIASPNYLVFTMFSLLFYLLFRKYVIRFGETILLFDTIGLSLFNMIGIKATLGCGHSMLVAVIMGVITGAGGGVMRDLLLQETPLIFQKKEIYAVACLLGGIAFAGLEAVGVNDVLSQIVAIAVVIGVRSVAHARNLSLPFTP